MRARKMQSRIVPTYMYGFYLYTYITLYYNENMYRSEENSMTVNVWVKLNTRDR